MPSVAFTQHFPGIDATAAFNRATDFENYSTITESVRQVRVAHGADGALHSHWDVNFRRGVLHWSERDVIDERAQTIEFTQIEGDLAEFHGRWSVTAARGGTEVSFRAYFDLGMPTLAELLDPVAQRALEENVRELMSAFAYGTASTSSTLRAA